MITLYRWIKKILTTSLKQLPNPSPPTPPTPYHPSTTTKDKNGKLHMSLLKSICNCGLCTFVIY